jgi:beta-barrel assembly-enhancing protease
LLTTSLKAAVKPNAVDRTAVLNPLAPAGPSRCRRALALLLCAVLALPASAQVRLPALGEAASQDLSVSAERRVGDQILREGRRDPDYLNDPVLLAYLNSLWLPLVAAARSRGDIEPEVDRAFVWEAFLVRDRSVNAFALPGGFVGVHLGLIAITATADQLASVLAHELTHVTQRHIARSIAPQQRASMLQLAGLLLAIAMAGRSNNADGSNAALMGGQAAAIQSQLNFSREVEREADRIGFAVLTAAGFAPSGMAQMFERLDQATRLNDNNGFPYLRSHPLTLDRVAEARNRTLLTEAAPAPTATAPGAPTLLHAQMQMRARVLMDDSAQALQRLTGATASRLLADRVAALYGAALAAALLREPARAQTLVQEALDLAQLAQPSEPAAVASLRLLQTELALKRGDASQALLGLDAIDAVGPAGGPTPANTAQATPLRAQPDWQRTRLLQRAQALLHPANPGGESPSLPATELTRFKTSTEALQTWLADAPTDAQAWEALAGTSWALGLKLRSLRALAEARAALGDVGGAIDRMRVAQQASRGAVGQDFIEGSVIDNRLRQLMALRRELALEAREARGGAGGGRSAPEEPPTKLLLRPWATRDGTAAP